MAPTQGTRTHAKLAGGPRLPRWSDPDVRRVIAGSRIPGTGRLSAVTSGHAGAETCTQEEQGGHGSIWSDTLPRRFGTVCPKEARVLTAKLTAILSNISNRQRASADPSSRLLILRGPRWTLTDARPAIFKTA